MYSIKMGNAFPRWSLPPGMWRLLRHLYPSFLVVLCMLINCSGAYPVIWSTSAVHKLLKGGEPATSCSSWRDINFMDTSCKGFHSVVCLFLIDPFDQILSCRVYGFCPGRTASYAFAHISALSHRLSRSKVKHAILFNDILKASSCLRHDRLLRAAKRYFSDQSIVFFLEIRHGHYQYVIRSGGQGRVLRVRRGVVEGDSLGPLLFLLVYHDFVMHEHSSLSPHVLDFLRAVPADSNRWCSSVTYEFLGDAFPADDAACVIVYDKIGELVSRIQCIFIVLLAFCVFQNMCNCKLLMSSCGEGAGKDSSTPEKNLHVLGWGRIAIDHHVKHLGVSRSK